MKLYTFKTNNNTAKNYNNYDSNATNELKSIIANNIANKYPWLSSSSTKSYHLTSPSSNYSFSSSLFNFDSDYNKAIAILDSYAAKKYNKSYLTFSDTHDEYDFEIDGTPIRIFEDMIQIGNSMILKNASPSYYAKIKPSFKETIIKITIKLNK